LVATGPIDEETLLLALAMGARGYLEQATIGRHLAKAVHSINQGEAWVPRRILGKMMERTLH
jgi:DNA-binding NarL/FixJ family response regulator